MINPFRPLVYLGQPLVFECEDGLEGADLVFIAVRECVRLVEGHKGSQGELVSQVVRLINRSEGLVAHLVARTDDSITIAVERRPPARRPARLAA